MIESVLCVLFLTVWAALSVFSWSSYRSHGKAFHGTFLRTFSSDILLIIWWVGLFRKTDITAFALILMIQKLVFTLIMQAIFNASEHKRQSAQIEMYRHEMDIMEQSQRQIGFLRHDMKNHIQHINYLLQNNETESLMTYLGGIAAALEAPDEFVRSGNHDIDSMLNYKLMTAKNMGAEIETDVKIPAELEISAFDVNVILGNLLDNAIEALSKCDRRKIAVSLRYETGVLFITVSNSCKERSALVTTKGAGHGIGLYSIRNTVNKYHGETEIENENGQFTVNVMLFVPV